MSSTTSPVESDNTETNKSGNGKHNEGTNDSNKRLKTDTSSFIAQDALNDFYLFDKVEHIQKEVLAAKPYPHGFIPNLFQYEFLNRVRDEVKANSKVNFKESDLFRVYQSIDMANLDTMEDETLAKLPSVLQLRNVLYSTEFRNFIEKCCNLPTGTLIDNGIDCAFNCHVTGCHLLCHDDVINTRKVSYIIYLTEDDWQAPEGGALELYDSYTRDGSTVRNPNVIPSKTILPQWNSMAFFVVEPGYSFHAVQEVFGSRPRLSLQGWFHAATPPSNIHEATLNRLKSASTVNNDSNNDGKASLNDDDTEGEYELFIYSDNYQQKKNEMKEDEDDGNKQEVLSQADIDYLMKYINPIYLKDDSVKDIQEKFEIQSSIQLREFLIISDGSEKDDDVDEEDLVQQLNQLCAIQDDQDRKVLLSALKHDTPTSSLDDNDGTKEYYNVGVTDEWKMIGPSHKQRFLEYTTTERTNSSLLDTSPTTAGQLLQHLKEHLLQSPAFGRYLNAITSLGLPEAYRGKIRRFRPGLDYTVAHYGLLTTTSVLDATLCFVAGKGDEILDPKIEEEVEGDDKDKCKSVKVAQFTAKGGEPDEADLLWQSGDCGGFECYIAADDEDDDTDDKNAAPDEYNADDDTELLSVHASNNTLSLVYRDPGTMRFIKYVTSQAPSSRWDIAMEYQVPSNEDENDQQDEGTVET